jgi:hypothetical protein
MATKVKPPPFFIYPDKWRNLMSILDIFMIMYLFELNSCYQNALGIFDQYFYLSMIIDDLLYFLYLNSVATLSVFLEWSSEVDEDFDEQATLPTTKCYARSWSPKSCGYTRMEKASSTATQDNSEDVKWTSSSFRRSKTILCHMYFLEISKFSSCVLSILIW